MILQLRFKSSGHDQWPVVISAPGGDKCFDFEPKLPKTSCWISDPKCYSFGIKKIFMLSSMKYCIKQVWSLYFQNLDDFWQTDEGLENFILFYYYFQKILKKTTSNNSMWCHSMYIFCPGIQVSWLEHVTKAFYQ